MSEEHLPYVEGRAQCGHLQLGWRLSSHKSLERGGKEAERLFFDGDLLGLLGRPPQVPKLHRVVREHDRVLSRWRGCGYVRDAESSYQKPNTSCRHN